MRRLRSLFKEETVEERLKRLQADQSFALRQAAARGDLGDVRFLLQHAISARGRNVRIILRKTGAYASSRTALHMAAENGHAHVVDELISRSKAAIHRTDAVGETALTLAATTGHLQVVRQLVESGAVIDHRSSSGRSALSYTVENDHASVVQELIKSGADVNSSDNEGTTTLMYATWRGAIKLVKELAQHGAEVEAKDDKGRTALWYAVQNQSQDGVEELLRFSFFDPKRTPKNTIAITPLFYVIEFGHTDLALKLIKYGASVSQKSYLSRSRRECETPLTIAGRAGHMTVFQALVEAGSPVNIRSGDGGETPLISVARWDYFNGVQVVVACGGALRFEDVSEDEYPLIPGTLETMAQLCGSTFEFKSVFTRLVERLQNVCLQLQEYCGGDDQIQVDTIVSFASTIFRVCGLMFQVTKRQTPLSRFIGSRAIARRIQDFHEELDHFLRMLNLPHVGTNWKAQWGEDQTQLQELLEDVLRRDISIFGRHRGDDDTKREAAFLLPELQNKNGEDLSDEKQRLKRESWIGSCVSPRFEVVQTESPERGQVVRRMSHHVTITLRLRVGARMEAAKSVLKRGVESQGQVHGELWSENIIVGSDSVTKLGGIREKPDPSNVRSGRQWLAPELDRPWSIATSESDIYAFEMCIKEAATGELPWRSKPYLDVLRSLGKGKFLKRPRPMNDAHWDLIQKVCVFDPAKRVTIAYVVNRLKQFADESEQTGKSIQAPRAVSSASEEQQLGILEQKFADLDGLTIPDTLQLVLPKCEQLPNDQWMKNKVYPALDFIFEQLRLLQKTPTDIEVQMYCLALSRLQRYLRTAVSEKSVYQLARSRQVAESHHVVYSELDRILDVLEIPESDPVRAWNRCESVLVPAHRDVNAVDVDAATENPNNSSDVVSLDHRDTPLASYPRWTQQGLEALKTRPSWYISLRNLTFSENTDQIGQGSFGAIIKGSWLNTPVVIKFMGYDEDIGTISTDLLLHEVRVWHRLNHPHVLKLYGACYVDKRYFVCEYASNGELTAFLKKPGNENLVWQKLYEAALGLEYLHGQNVAHNDLKCDNIMVGEYGRAKLIDFGLSCILNEVEIKIDVKKMGAVNWRYPEYLAGERPSLASDVYSFAMCIIEAMSSKMPWGVPMIPAQIRFQLRRGNIPNLPDIVSEKQKNLIHLMTMLDFTERMRMAFVVNKLNEFAQDEKARAGVIGA